MGNLPAYKSSEKVDDFTVDIEIDAPYPRLLIDLIEFTLITSPATRVAAIDDLALVLREESGRVQHRLVVQRRVPKTASFGFNRKCAV